MRNCSWVNPKKSFLLPLASLSMMPLCAEDPLLFGRPILPLVRHPPPNSTTKHNTPQPGEKWGVSSRFSLRWSALMGAGSPPRGVEREGWWVGEIWLLFPSRPCSRRQVRSAKGKSSSRARSLFLLEEEDQHPLCLEPPRPAEILEAQGGEGARGQERRRKGRMAAELEVTRRSRPGRATVANGEGIVVPVHPVAETSLRARKASEHLLHSACVPPRALLPCAIPRK